MVEAAIPNVISKPGFNHFHLICSTDISHHTQAREHSHGEGGSNDNPPLLNSYFKKILIAAMIIVM